MKARFSVLAGAGVVLLAAQESGVLAQTFQRLGACPTLGCVFPPDQADFLAGQYFDIRLEVHAPVNGSEAEGNPSVPDENFTFTIAKAGQEAVPVTEFFDVEDPEIERWSFTWYEDLFAKDAESPSLVEVAAKAYRRVALYEPGEYEATLTYYDGSETKATWLVRDLSEERRAKNVLMFIGDGMTTNMITAARLIAHKAVNGKYQTKMAMDQFPVLGHQMTHSIDSFITDSANSATALYSGHKTSVNALGVYGDSSPSPFDDPKVESVAELFRRRYGGGIGIVSTADVSDATPAALTAHSRDRGQSAQIIETTLNGINNYSWPEWDGPDVLFGGGAGSFLQAERGGLSFDDKDFYEEFANKGYQVALSQSELDGLSDEEKALGIFTVSHMSVWLDRNVYTDNLLDTANAPDGSESDATDQPGLKEMTLKAIDILDSRSSDNGWFLMSEAASIDKQMHALDYDRALGDLLELDDTIKASIQRLQELGSLKETLILVTADHGHGFDVMGSVDTQYFNAQTDDRAKRKAVGIYENAGLSEYVNGGSEGSQRLTYSEGVHFPATWDPRYTLFQGMMANPDRRANWQVHKDGPREPAVNFTEEEDYYVNPEDAPQGILLQGTLPPSMPVGVHSLTDVPVFAMGPCQDLFSGVYSSVDIFFGMAECLGLAGDGPEEDEGGYDNEMEVDEEDVEDGKGEELEEEAEGEDESGVEEVEEVDAEEVDGEEEELCDGQPCFEDVTDAIDQ